MKRVVWIAVAAITEKTKFSKGANVATKADLAEGVRLSVSVENDGKTATSVKIAPATVN
jgi:hypothetical protein